MNMKYIKHSLLVCFIFLFSGCIETQMATGVVQYLDRDNYLLKHITSTDFESIAQDLVDQIDPALQEYAVGAESPLLVSDFVSLDTLSNNSKLGFLLAELIKNDLVSRKKIPVKEVKLGRDFILGKSGFRMLSHDVKKINNNLAQSQYAFIGTYTFTNEQLIITLKMIDITEGILIGAATKKRILTNEIMELESQPNSGYIYTPTVL